MRRLLERGAGVTARDPEGATALVAAAYGNHVEAARALAHAEQRGQDQIAAILRDAGARR